MNTTRKHTNERIVSRKDWDAKVAAAAPTLEATPVKVTRSRHNGMSTVTYWCLAWTILGVPVDTDGSDAGELFKTRKEALAHTETERAEILNSVLAYENTDYGCWYRMEIEPHEAALLDADVVTL